MFFGKYLMENGVVTPEQLVEAITIQMESLPSIVRMVRKKNMLDCREIVELVDKSIDEKKNIMELIVEKSIFAKDEMNGLLDDRFEAGKGLCEILVRKGHVSSMMISEHIKKYLKRKNQTSDGMDATREVEGVLSFDVRGEFVKIFDEDFFQGIKAEIESIKNRDKEQHIFNLKKELTLLVTVADMGHLLYVVDLLQIWLNILDKSEKISDKNHWNEVASGLLYAMDLIWILREQFFKKGNDEVGQWKEKYFEGMKRAQYLAKDFQSDKKWA